MHHYMIIDNQRITKLTQVIVHTTQGMKAAMSQIRITHTNV